VQSASEQRLDAPASAAAPPAVVGDHQVRRRVTRARQQRLHRSGMWRVQQLAAVASTCTPLIARTVRGAASP
jgi:hypothetical protein